MASMGYRAYVAFLFMWISATAFAESDCFDEVCSAQGKPQRNESTEKSSGSDESSFLQSFLKQRTLASEDAQDAYYEVGPGYCTDGHSLVRYAWKGVHYGKSGKVEGQAFESTEDCFKAVRSFGYGYGFAYNGMNCLFYFGDQRGQDGPATPPGWFGPFGSSNGPISAADQHKDAYHATCYSFQAITTEVQTPAAWTWYGSDDAPQSNFWTMGVQNQKCFIWLTPNDSSSVSHQTFLMGLSQGAPFVFTQNGITYESKLLQSPFLYPDASRIFLMTDVVCPTSRQGRLTVHPPVAKPHVVLVLIDDMGFNDFIDSETLGPAWKRVKALKPNAIYTKNSYTDVICAPSRRALMSGRFVRMMTGGKEWSYKRETPVGRKLALQGYVTYMVGKWHAGSTSWKTIPLGRGFNRSICHLENLQNYTSPCADGNAYPPRAWDIHYAENFPFENPASSVTNPTYRYGFEIMNAAGQCRYRPEFWDEKVTSWMSQHKQLHPNNPLFMYYAPTSLRKSGQDDHPNQNAIVECQHITNLPRKRYCAAASFLDTSIGKVIDILQGPLYHGRGDDYVMIITSDNGGATFNEFAAGNNYPLRGSKNEVYEGGIRVPAMVWGKHPDLKPPSEGGNLGNTWDQGFMHLVDWHFLVAELGGYNHSGAVNERDSGVPGLWTALTTNKRFEERTMLMGGGRGAKILNLVKDRKQTSLWYRKNNLKMLRKPHCGADNRNAIPRHEGWWWPDKSGFDNDAWFRATPPNASSDLAGKCWWEHAGIEYQVFDLSTDPNEKDDLYARNPSAYATMLNEFDRNWRGGYKSSSDAGKCLTTNTCRNPNQQRYDALSQANKTLLANACPGKAPTTMGPRLCMGDFAGGWCGA